MSKLSFSLRSLPMVGLALFALLLSVGCSGVTEVKLQIDPADAQVRVVNTATDQAISVEGKRSPFVLPLRFTGGGTEYRVIARRDGYDPASMLLTRQAVRNLPRTGEDDTPTLSMRLIQLAQIRFLTNPTNASLELVDPAGEVTQLKSGDATGLTLRPDQPPYRLRVTGPGFDTMQITLTPQMINEALRDRDGAIYIELANSDYRLMEQQLVLYKPGVGFVVNHRSLRAWMDDRNARERTSVMAELNADLTVRGLAITPDARHLVYSFFDPTSPDQRLTQATLFSLPLRRQTGPLPLPRTTFVDVDPFVGRDAAQTLLFASDGQNRLVTSDILSTSRAAPRELRMIVRGTGEVAMLNPSLGYNGRMVYTAMPNRSAVDLKPELMTIEGFGQPGGAGLTPKVLLSNASQPRVSPDGSKVAFIGGVYGDVYVMDTQGGKPIRITNNSRDILTALSKDYVDFNPRVYRPYASPAWSPDGQYILYSGMSGKDSTGRYNYDLWIAPAEGGDPIQATSDGSADLMPVWSHDNYLYFVSNRGGRWAIHRIDSPVSVQMTF